MRTDEKARLREQKKQMLAEMRTIAKTARADPENDPRWQELKHEVEEINRIAEAEHERELREIREGRGVASSGVASVPVSEMERPFAREPLYDAFRRAGFARGEPAEIPWSEFRALTWTGSVDNLNQPRRDAVALGYDQRYAYQALPSVGVDRGVTSISLLTQTARTLATPANVIRAIDAITAKPETAETLTLRPCR